MVFEAPVHCFSAILSLSYDMYRQKYGALVHACDREAHLKENNAQAVNVDALAILRLGSATSQ